jgi:hypothetical protein
MKRIVTPGRMPMKIALLSVPALLLLFAGCRQSFDYYNPLDPSEDAALSEILPFIEDPVIRNAILDSGALNKSELGQLWVEGLTHGGAVTTGAGMEFLSYTSNLQFRSTGLPDSLTGDLSSLGKMRSLERLELHDNVFSEANLDAIPHIRSLRDLILEDNAIADAAGLVPLLERYNRGQLSLSVGWNTIDAGTLIALRPVLDRLYGLNISGLDPVGEDLDLDFLASNTTIDGLDISYNTLTGTLSPLGRLSELRWFYARSTNMDGALFSTMPHLPHLNYINLRDNLLTDLTPVTTALSSYNRGQLRLEIGDNPYGAGALGALAPAMDRLHGLEIPFFGSTGPLTNLDSLPTNDTIRYFNVTGHTISDISAISRLRELESFDMENNGAGFVAGSEALLNLPRLRMVWVVNSPGIDQWVLDELRSRGVEVYD